MAFFSAVFYFLAGLGRNNLVSTSSCFLLPDCSLLPGSGTSCPLPALPEVTAYMIQPRAKLYHYVNGQDE